MARYAPKNKLKPPYLIVFFAILTALAIVWRKLCPHSSIAVLTLVILLICLVLAICARV